MTNTQCDFKFKSKLFSGTPHWPSQHGRRDGQGTSFFDALVSTHASGCHGSQRQTPQSFLPDPNMRQGKVPQSWNDLAIVSLPSPTPRRRPLWTAPVTAACRPRTPAQPGLPGVACPETAGQFKPGSSPFNPQANPRLPPDLSGEAPQSTRSPPIGRRKGPWPQPSTCSPAMPAMPTFA